MIFFMYFSIFNNWEGRQPEAIDYLRDVASVIILAAFYGFIFKVRILKNTTWKVLYPVAIVFIVLYAYRWVEGSDASSYTTNNVLISLAFVAVQLPAFIASFIYVYLSKFIWKNI